jgi:hypothetical protein
MDRIVEPVVILGAPRSGTTLLAEILGEHPDVARTREARLVWRFGNDRRSDELGPEHARPEVVAHIHKTFLDLAGGTGRLVEKTPANSVRPWFVDTVFPDARYVHITRDGWACVPSIRRLWTERGSGIDSKQVSKAKRRLREAHPAQLRHYATEAVRRLVGSRHTALYGPRLAGMQEVADELGVLVAATDQWRTSVERCRTFGAGVDDRYLEVKLETLDIEGVGRILDHCGLARDHELLSRFEDRFDPAQASRRVPISEDERRMVQGAIDATNTWLGYPGP